MNPFLSGDSPEEAAIYRVTGSDTLSQLIQRHPFYLVFAQFSDGTSAGYWGRGVSVEGMIRQIRRRDPGAVVRIYQENLSVRYQLVTPGEYGAGWYVIVDAATGPIRWGHPDAARRPYGPPHDPRLVRAERMVWHDHHPPEVTGVDCDTGERWDTYPVYYLLGPREEDAAPFRHDKAARFKPSRVHPTPQF